MALSHVQPKHIRYIKLGDGGRWARKSIEDGVLSFGYRSVTHELCEEKNWGAVRRMLSDRKSEGAMTAGVTEIRAFYELGVDCLWITFSDQDLWWTFAHPEVQWTGDSGSDGPSRKRVTLDGWHNTDVSGKRLRITELSSKLTKVGNFRATICRVEEEKYLLRRINGEEEPVVVKAKKARIAMIKIAVDMIRGLHWADFETLADLIFARSGWQRSTRVGGTQADYDIVMEQPTTGEIAFVQVKSDATQAEVNDNLQKFRRGGYSRFFFVCHKGEGRLTLPNEPYLHLFEGERLANAAVKNGLFDWLIERSG